MGGLMHQPKLTTVGTTAHRVGAGYLGSRVPIAIGIHIAVLIQRNMRYGITPFSRDRWFARPNSISIPLPPLTPAPILQIFLLAAASF